MGTRDDNDGMCFDGCGAEVTSECLACGATFAGCEPETCSECGRGEVQCLIGGVHFEEHRCAARVVERDDLAVAGLVDGEVFVLDRWTVGRGVPRLSGRYRASRWERGRAVPLSQDLDELVDALRAAAVARGK